jgi:photosystem II stability/assembly factor-like uncharacterized protein
MSAKSKKIMKIKLNFGWLVTGIMICVLSAASIYAGTETVRFNGWQTVGPNGGDIRAMAIDPRDKNRLYITTLDGQIYTSADAGKVWHLLTTFNRPQITLDDILVDVEDSNYIYVSGHRHLGPGGFLYSQDAGRTWKEAKDLRNEAIHALTQSRKNPNILLAGGNGKVFISYNKGEDWTRMNDDTVAFSKQLVD